MYGSNEVSSGRTKGAINKATKPTKEALALLIENNLEQLQKDLMS